VGCGGGGTGTTGGNPTPQGKLVDPSGNWKMNFVDSTGNNFILAGLFSQTGSVVTGLSFSEFGNGQFANPPTSFQCVAQTNVSMANGTVQNTNQFSGDLSGNFGTVHFTSTLNDAGTHASGTYTVTPGANGNCLGVAGGELLIPTIVLLYGLNIKLAGSLSLTVSLPTMIVGFARYTRSDSFAVLRQEKPLFVWMAIGSILGAAVGGLLLGLVPTHLLLTLLGVILLISAVKTFQHSK
jgi:hypothetical protein